MPEGNRREFKIIMFEKYKSKEDLIKAITGKIKEAEGQFYLEPPENVSKATEIQELLDKEIEKSKGYRKRSQEAEAKVAELEQTVEKQKTQFDEVNKLNPQELQERLKTYATEKADLMTRVKELTSKLDPITQELNGYKQRETTSKIRELLTAEAKKQGIRQEALRDVARLSSRFKIDADGQLISEDNKSCSEVIAAEKAVSPHWLPPSIGGGSNPGLSNQNVRLGAYNAAKEKGDLAAMIANAPPKE
jgi:signal recognition particle subunit SEC65